MEVSAHKPEDLTELRRRMETANDARQRDRYRAVLMALDGRETMAIAEFLERSRWFVQQQVYAYRDRGIDALKLGKPTGKRSRLNADQQAKLKERIVKGPLESDETCALRGRDAQRILEEEMGVKYSLSAVYNVLHRIGLSPLRPRPQHPKNDPAKSQEWLESAPFLSRKSRMNIPTSKSKSGSRTKPGSDSKER